MQTTEALLGLLRERGKRGLPLKRIYRQLYNLNLYLTAYGRIYRNAGAMTPGVTEETVDAMSLEKIRDIIQAVRQERYQWQPARRTYVPKKNGKKRPLGMPVWSDKLLAEVIRSILNAYFDGTFSEHSHGFRPERGCHTALREIYHTWKGTTWIIEGDIADCFGSLNHDLILSALAEHIQDGRFLTLVKKLLDAGYMEDWKFKRTLSGVPQGSILSPVLSNILLSKLDRFVETELLPQYNKGGRRKANQAYRSLMNRAHRLRKNGQKEAAQKIKRQAQKLPAIDPQDPDYRRLKYCRYADDFALAFIGPKAEAEEIKQRLRTFLQRRTQAGTVGRENVAYPYAGQRCQILRLWNHHAPKQYQTHPRSERIPRPEHQWRYRPQSSTKGRQRKMQTIQAKRETHSPGRTAQRERLHHPRHVSAGISGDRELLPHGF